MSEEKVFLNSVHIKNFRNLWDVELPLKPLTVIVGPNASGKSNILDALYLTRNIINDGINPFFRVIRDSFWAREANNFSFNLQAQVRDVDTEYELVVKKRKSGKYLYSERLLVNNRNIISIIDCKGTVESETDDSKTEYNNSDVPALVSAGSYGNRPISRILYKFIKGWVFHDLDPDFAKKSLRNFSPADDEIQKDLKLSIFGGNLAEVLWDLYKKNDQSFIDVVHSLYDVMNFRINYETIDGDDKFSLIEKGKKSLPLEVASDGTLRLIAYLILRNESEPPSLIAFEEPERGFHPGMLNEVTNILRKISENSQVIITTHSSELLNAFQYSDFSSDSLGILLLRNHPKEGTDIINVNERRRNDEDLSGWMADFGIGSAIFDSPFLQTTMEDSA